MFFFLILGLRSHLPIAKKVCKMDQIFPEILFSPEVEVHFDCQHMESISALFAGNIQSLSSLANVSEVFVYENIIFYFLWH